MSLWKNKTVTKASILYLIYNGNNLSDSFLPNQGGISECHLGIVNRNDKLKKRVHLFQRFLQINNVWNTIDDVTFI